MKHLIALSAICLSMSVSAAQHPWTSDKIVDEMSEVTDHIALSVTTGDGVGDLETGGFGVRCTEVGDNKAFSFFYGLSDVIATHNSPITLKVKVDKHRVVTLRGQAFQDQRSGYAYSDGQTHRDLVKQLKTGTVAKVRIINNSNYMFDYAVSLNNFANASNDLLELCSPLN